jgi:hypothetical protein
VLLVALAITDATARGRPELVVPAWDTEGEWHWGGDFAGLGYDELYRGHEGVKRCIETWITIWTEQTYTAHEVLDGGDIFLMRWTISGRSILAGVPAEMQLSSVARFDPLLVYFQNFRDDAEALQEAGFAQFAQPGR